MELRAASDMPQSGLKCIVRKIKAKDIFGKITDHYQMHILASDLSWDVKYKFAAIKKFAVALNDAYLQLPLEQRLPIHLYRRRYLLRLISSKIKPKQGTMPTTVLTICAISDIPIANTCRSKDSKNKQRSWRCRKNQLSSV